MNENMTYVPSRLTSAKTEKVVAGANEILDDDINLKQDVINTLSKKVIDLNSVPTSSTLTYTVNSVTCNFKVGDEVRVADQESETGYTFYKLYALTTEEGITTATWDKLGAGGGGGTGQIGELAIINLTSNQEDKSDLIGATVKVFNTDDPTEIFLETTWQGTAIELEIQVPINYTVQVGSVTGYYIASTQSYSTRTIRTRNITFEYYTEIVTVTVNTNATGVTAKGQIITINGVNTTVPASGQVTQKVPFGTSYTISVNSKGGYNTPSNLTYTANSISRTATMTYTKILDGIYAVNTTGDLVTYADINASSPSSYVGVAIKDSSKNMSFFIDKRFPTGSAAAANVGNYKAWSNALEDKDQTYLTNITGAGGDGQSIVIPTETRTKAFNVYNNGETGVVNTTNLINDPNVASENASNNAAKYCRSIANPVTGSYDGYLGSLAEWIVVNDNLAAVNQILNKIGGVEFAVTNSGYAGQTIYSTSSEKQSGMMWALYFTNAPLPYINYNYKYAAYKHTCVRPFFPLND